MDVLYRVYCGEHLRNTVKILSNCRAFIRKVTFHRDGGGHLLEATNARKVIKTSGSCNFSQKVAILKKAIVSLSP